MKKDVLVVGGEGRVLMIVRDSERGAIVRRERSLKTEGEVIRGQQGESARTPALLDGQ